MRAHARDGVNTTTINLLQALGSTTWGWHSLNHHQVYIAVVYRAHNMQPQYGHRCCQLQPLPTNMRVRLKADRAITGLVCNTPVDAVLMESKLPLISMCFQTISLLKADLWAHLPQADDHHQTLFTPCRQN